MLTFKKFRETVAPYAGRAGKCATTEEVSDFAIQIMQDLLISGSYAGVRKICVQARRGCISLPPEVDVPLKVKIDNRNANLWSKWFEFHSTDDSWGLEGQYPAGIYPAGQVMVEEGTDSPLIYEVPQGGSLLAVIGNCEEEEDATITIAGKDVTGRPIFTHFKGEKIFGEKFRIKKLDRRVGGVPFGTVTSVIKPETNGYVTLVAFDPETGQDTFLADWNPSETTPMYRRFRILHGDCAKCETVNLSILCRIKLKNSYLDNELTLFENKTIVQLAAQRVQAETNNDLPAAQYKDQALDKKLDQESGFKKISGSPVSVFFPTSGGSIRNINSGLGRYARGRW